MKFIMFTKHLEGLEIPDIITALQSVGVSGADLCVRPGYPVNPENATEALPAAAKQFAAAGLSIPLVTTPVIFLIRGRKRRAVSTPLQVKQVSKISNWDTGTGTQRMAATGHRSILSVNNWTGLRNSLHNTDLGHASITILEPPWG